MITITPDDTNYEVEQKQRDAEKLTAAVAQHKDMVRVLAKPGAAILQSLTPERCHLLHMAYALPGEIAELAEAIYDCGPRDNIVEELGDVEFYLCGLRQSLGIEYAYPDDSQPASTGLFNTIVHVVIATGKLCDALKKPLFYEKPLDDTRFKVLDLMVALETQLSRLRRQANVSRFETLQANYAKLSVRYNGLKYSNEAAQLRADKPAGE